MWEVEGNLKITTTGESFEDKQTYSWSSVPACKEKVSPKGKAFERRCAERDTRAGAGVGGSLRLTGGGQASFAGRAAKANPNPAPNLLAKRVSLASFHPGQP